MPWSCHIESIEEPQIIDTFLVDNLSAMVWTDDISFKDIAPELGITRDRA